MFQYVSLNTGGNKFYFYQINWRRLFMTNFNYQFKQLDFIDFNVKCRPNIIIFF